MGYLEDTNMLCRLSISLIFSAWFVGAAELNTTKLLPTNFQMENVRQRYSELNKTDAKNIKQFEKLNTFKDVEKIQALFKQQRIANYGEIQAADSKKTSQIIFYLFSKTVPDETVKNIFKAAKKLPNKYDFYGVLRGLDKDGLKKMETWHEIDGVTVKINPIIFDEAQVNTVPAVVYAECKTTAPILRTGSCAFKKVLFGDVSLEFALEKMGLD